MTGILNIAGKGCIVVLFHATFCRTCEARTSKMVKLALFRHYNECRYNPYMLTHIYTSSTHFLIQNHIPWAAGGSDYSGCQNKPCSHLLHHVQKCAIVLEVMAVIFSHIMSFTFSIIHLLLACLGSPIIWESAQPMGRFSFKVLWLKLFCTLNIHSHQMCISQFIQPYLSSQDMC